MTGLDGDDKSGGGVKRGGERCGELGFCEWANGNF